MDRALVLRNARAPGDFVTDIAIGGGRVLRAPPEGAETVDLEGALVLPALVNAHDHLDLSTAPPLGRPPYRNGAAWAADVSHDSGAMRAALAVPLVDRLFLGGIRNLLAGTSAVVHHGAFHRSLARPDFPVKVLEKYGFALALSERVKRTYRTTDRRIPWLIHLGEGTDEGAGRELERLAELNLLRHNTVLIHGIALREEDGERLAQAQAALVWCPETNLRLYGRTAPVAALRAAGVRVGLGSDSPAAGGRDLLSALAAARAAGVFLGDELLKIATEGSAGAARLPLGGVAPGDPADLLVVASKERLLAGDRTAIRLTLVGGRPLFGEVDLLARLGVRSSPATLDLAPRGLEAKLSRRLAGIRMPQGALWREGFQLP